MSIILLGTIISSILTILALFLIYYGYKVQHTNNKRIIEVTKLSGNKEYRCEYQTSDLKWHTMKIFKGVDYYEWYEPAVFDNKDDALKFINKHPDQIIKEEVIIEI